MEEAKNHTKYIFCMKWGTLYGAEYVNRLFSMVKKNLTYDFKMVCFTDNSKDIIDEVDCYDIPEMQIRTDIPERMWKKLTTLKKDLYELKRNCSFFRFRYCYCR